MSNVSVKLYVAQEHTLDVGNISGRNRDNSIDVRRANGVAYD